MSRFFRIVVAFSFLFFLEGCYLLPNFRKSPEVIETGKEKGKDEESQKEEAQKETITVVGVNDGDTITVLFENREEETDADSEIGATIIKNERKIRLATIDAPEYNQAFGKRSRQSLSDLVYKKKIQLKKMGQDRYGRIIGEVFLDGKNINAEQIRRGLAWHYKRHVNQQSQKSRILYESLEKEARVEKRGLWQKENPIPPWSYRNDRRNNRDNGNRK